MIPKDEKMNIVSWNANGKFREKILLFSPATTDVLVIQECENTEKSQALYRAAGWDFHWISENQHRGLGIFVPLRRRCKKLSWGITDCQYFLPVEVRDKIIIVGVWAMGGKSKSTSYAGQITRFLDSNAHRLNSNKIVLIGDFNSNAIWDKRHRVANHTANDKRLVDVGLTSLYHREKSEEQGKETTPTFYMYRKKEKPYHIDYVYLPEKILETASIDVGCPDQWLQYSDHMPLFITL